jgi:uncharacterized membrane protein YphA (DoxX/SURF4 family)
MKNRSILTWTLTLTRMVIGWYFLYEGIHKLLTPQWTAKIFLMDSRWIFSGIFQQMAENPALMQIIDFLNIWGLILIGISLVTGMFVRWSSIAGSVLLLFYFAAYPPLPGYTFGTVSEGSYLWVNRTFILMFILIIFALLPSGIWYGIDRMISRWKKEKPEAPVPAGTNENTSLQRRELLRDLISVPVMGAFAYALYKKRKWESFRRKIYYRKSRCRQFSNLKKLSFYIVGRFKSPGSKR